ncbi:MAG: hypothetical protein U0271_34100 [Polyangiaceae bacterium]
MTYLSVTSWAALAAAAGLAVAGCHLVIGYEDGHLAPNAGGAGGEGGSGNFGGGGQPLPPATCETNSNFVLQIGDEANQDLIVGAVGESAANAIAGSFEGKLEIGSKSQTAQGRDGFVARLDTAGEAAFMTKIPGTDEAIGQQVDRVAIGPNNSFFLAGTFDGVVPLDGNNQYTAQGIDGFVSAVGPAGAGVWYHAFGGPGEQRARAVTLAGPTVIVGGDYHGSLRIDQDPEIANSGAATRAFIASFQGGNGTLVKTHLFNIPDHVSVTGFAMAPGGVPYCALGGAEGGVAVLESDLSERWVKQFGFSVQGVAHGPGDELVAIGTFKADPMLPGQDISSAGGDDAVIFRLDPETGDVLWATRLGGAFDDRGADIAVGCDGRVIAIADVIGSITIGGSPALDGPEESRVFVARLDLQTGTTLSFERLRGTGDHHAQSISVNGGAPLITGTFTKEIFFGEQQLPAVGQADLFAVQLPLAAAGDP